MTDQKKIKGLTPEEQNYEALVADVHPEFHSQPLTSGVKPVKKKKELQNSELATQLAEHLNNIRKLVLDADQLVHQARQEADAIKKMLEERSKNNDG
jgi:hypothetical protein